MRPEEWLRTDRPCACPDDCGETVQPGAEAARAKLETYNAAALDTGKANQYYLGMGEQSSVCCRPVFLSGYSSREEIADVHDLAAASDASNPGAINLVVMRFAEVEANQFYTERSRSTPIITRYRVTIGVTYHSVN